jgi:subtilase family serine protease
MSVRIPAAAARAAAAVLLCALVAAPAGATGRSSKRADLISLPGTATPEAARGTVLNAVAADTQIPIVVTLDFADREGALAFAQAVNDPKSPEYRQFLTPEEIGDRFGPSPARYDAVIAYLKSKGIAVTGTTRNRMAIKAAGTAAQMSAAFGTTIRWYRESNADRIRRAGRFAAALTFYSNDGPVKVPAGLSSDILAVVGLENYYQPIRRMKRAAAFRQTSNGPFYPAAIITCYDCSPFYSASSQPGSGRTIGISSFDGITHSDVTTWITQAGLSYPSAGPASNVTYIGTAPRGAQEGEAALDVEWSLGMSPYAAIRVYQGANSTSGLVTVLTDEVDDNLVDVATESYGWSIASSSTLNSLDTLHTDMAMQGITYFAASGDNSASGTASYPYPIVNPNVTVVGGTIPTLNDDNTWNSEIGWNDSGGGYSTTDNASRPPWQVGRGIPTSPTIRLDPDVALIAAADNTGTNYVAYFIWKGVLYTADGTSLASPTTASSIALVEQYLIANGYLPANGAGKQRLGAWNGTLYGFNGRNDVYHDIVSGNNGYAAGQYWDYVTGWGSFDFYNLAIALEAPLAVDVTPQNPTIDAGTTLQLAAAVAGSTNQTVSWSVSSGPGSVNATTGLYTAPATVASTQTATVVATSAIDYAAPGATTGSALTGQTVITIRIPQYAVSGTVGLQQCVNLAQSINFTFRPSSGSSFTDTVTLGSDGSFSIPNVPAGTYTIAVKGAKWLQKDLTGVVVNGAVSGLAPALLGGDLNGDNIVDLQDFSILAEAFGTDSSSAGWNAVADINCDGVVDLQDFAILASNFGQAGDP